MSGERIAYGDDPDQFGEWWMPVGGARGTAMLLHGGYYRSRHNLDLMDPIAADLAARGWAVWNVEYRRPDAHDWPATVADVRAALVALARIPSFVPDLPLIVVGHSAGGQLALQVAEQTAALALQIAAPSAPATPAAPAGLAGAAPATHATFAGAAPATPATFAAAALAGAAPATHAATPAGATLAGAAPATHATFAGVAPATHAALAGAALAAAAPGTNATRDPSLATPPPIALAVSLAGVVDLPGAHARNSSDGAIAMALGGSPAEQPERYAAASPSLFSRRLVQWLLVQGTDDADDFALPNRDLAANGRLGHPELLELPGDHFAVIDPATPIWQATVARITTLVS